MKLPKSVTLFHAPSKVDVDAEVVELTEAMIEHRMGEAWWGDPAIEPASAEEEIDRHWDWAELEIEREGRRLRARRFAVATQDGVVQGAMMASTEAVACERKPDRGRPALFVELFFAAPRNREWIRTDKAEQFRGVGLHLLRTAAELSEELDCDGRLKLESSPGFVDWYKRRGLLEVSSQRILHEGVKYTPMELQSDRVGLLLAARKKGA